MYPPTHGMGGLLVPHTLAVTRLTLVLNPGVLILTSLRCVRTYVLSLPVVCSLCSDTCIEASAFPFGCGLPVSLESCLAWVGDPCPTCPSFRTDKEVRPLWVPPMLQETQVSTL